MKKISVLLIAFLLVASFAFAQSYEPSVSISGDATLTFGIDLEEGTTGFKNDFSSSITLTLVPLGTEQAGPEGEVSGIIELKDFRVDLSTANATRITAGAVTAWIFIDPVEIKIYSAPTLAYAESSDWDTLREDEQDDKAAVTGLATTPGGFAITAPGGTITYQGVTITVPVEPVTVELQFASRGDWEDNVDNEYATGLKVSGELAEGVSGSLGGFFGNIGPNDAEYGLSATLDLDFAPVTVAAKIDLPLSSDDFDWDGRLTIGLDLDVVEVTFNTFAFTAGGEISENVLFGLGLDLGGLDENLDLAIQFETENTFVEDGLLLALNLDVAYDIDGIKPFADYTFFGEGPTLEAYMNLTAGVEFSGFVPLTVFTLQYDGTDITDANGIREQYLTFATKVSF